jgi:hypothetical protein
MRSDDAAPTRRRLAAAVLAVLALAGCTQEDPPVHPFAIRVVEPDGPLPADPALAPLLVVEGPAVRLDARTLQITDPVKGQVTVTFDNAAAPDIAFPDTLEGAEVRVVAQFNADARDPAGRPLPYPALRVSTGAKPDERFHLLLADSPYTDLRGLADIPRPIGVEPDLGDVPPVFPDFPGFTVFSNSARFTPGKCGLVYYDVLRVFGEQGATTDLRADEIAALTIGVEPTPWVVRHVVSWHRTGTCEGSARTWTQFAARR